MTTLSQKIEGSARSRIWREFVTTSALYPVFDAIRVLSTEGVIAYLTELPHYLIFAAAGLQAWFLGRRPLLPWYQRAIGSLIAPALYTLIDMGLEGITSFWSKPNHWIYWLFSLGIALFFTLEGLLPRLRPIILMGMNIWRVMLFPILYATSELTIELSTRPTWADFQDYWFGNSGHIFILLASLLFGLLLGLREIDLDDYLQVLRQVARQLKQVSEWSLDADLLARSMQDEDALSQQRVNRAVLFSDVRGFTQWSEQQPPETVVKMLNQFYELADKIVVQKGGTKPHFIGDEVMTWFADPATAVAAACQLRDEVTTALQPFGLQTGTGVHWGEVVEGLMGSSDTRNYNILGDTVNTASRLVSAAQPGEVLISETLWELVKSTAVVSTSSRDIQAKGKERPLRVHSIINQPN